MSAIADRPVQTGPVKTPQVSEGSRQSGVFTVLLELGAASAASGELDGVLRRAVARTCEVLGIRRCGVYLREDEGEIFAGRCAHPRAEIEPAVRRLRLGGPNDEITRELASSRRPILIRDAHNDPRASLAAIRC